MLAGGGLRRGGTVVSISVDREADVAAIDLHDGKIARTIKIGLSLLADYDDQGRLLCVEILSLGALHRPDVARQLRELLGVVPSNRPAAAASSRPLGNSVVLTNEPRIDLVDTVVFQTADRLVEARA
jgi:hypothetical protein